MTAGIFSSGSHLVFLFIGLVLCAAVGYFIGAINSAVIISRVRYRDDVREHGSGNAGMTNMLRTYGKGAAVMTLVGDLGKGVIACMLGTLLLGESGANLAGLFCMVGHVWPVYFKFKGGKGVLVLAATVLCCNPLVFLILITFFILIVSCTRYISLGSIIAALLYPIVLSRFSEPNIIITLCSMTAAILVFFMHMPNIRRLREGNENKLSFGKDGKFLPKYILVIINAVLILATAAALFGKIAVSNAYFERAKTAASCEQTVITGVQMRYIYLDYAMDYMENNPDSDIAKNYDKNKKYCEQYTDGQSYAEFFMEGAKYNAERLLKYYNAALASGVAQPDDSILDDVYAEIQKEFVTGETADRYFSRIYGLGMKNSDVNPILMKEAYIGKYITYTGYEKSEEQASSYTVTFDEEVISDLLKEY